MPARRLLIAIAITVQLVFAASAHAYVYWGDPHAGTIGRANNDGSGVEDAFIHTGGEPRAIAVNSSHIYWANEAGGTIGRANIDGMEVEPNFIAGLDHPNGVTVSSSLIFWSTGGNQKIGSAELDGNNPNPSLIPSEGPPCGVAVDSGSVYWTHVAGAETEIGRASFNGGSQKPEFVKTEASFTCGVAVNTANIFWPETGIGNGAKIGRANILDGKAVNPSLIGDAHGPCGVAVFGNQLYWANSGNGAIGRANIVGTGAEGVNEAAITTGSTGICGVAVDSLTSPLEPPAEPSSPAPPAAPPSAAPATLPPSVRVVGDKLDKKNGTARVIVAVSGAGLVSLQGKGIVAAVKKARGAETVALSVRPAKAKKSTLRRVGRLRAKLSISFAPGSGGSVPTAGTTLTLVEKQASPKK
jgi:hypothetical protein